MSTPGPRSARHVFGLAAAAVSLWLAWTGWQIVLWLVSGTILREVGQILGLAAGLGMLSAADAAWMRLMPPEPDTPHNNKDEASSPTL